ncbi:MFS transporter [Sansalvadorimonas verongulae]|uniref:MFS transporter n=1 Tax=Sansalvadorimonas verongulae TaxID=2172824 RepID=UPI0012BC1EBA|nr:MFS transporter [Sansalvadorimonas verongulae]MTI14765.1 MFS transporter [Sansalvadorimonas verongulae]
MCHSQSSYPSYRWIMLIVMMALTVAIEMQWLTHAAVARPAEAFYSHQIEHHSWLSIDNLALTYMIMYVVLALPASWVIARHGLKYGLQIGALMTGAFSLLKGFCGENLTIVTIAQLGLAAAQPFILNAVTTLTDQWFPVKERAMTAGLTVFAQFVGILLAVVVTPMMVVTNPADVNYGQGLSSALMLYGMISGITAVFALLLVRHPPAFADTRIPPKTLFAPDALVTLLKNHDMQIGLFLFMVGLGIFNAIGSLTDAISASLNIEDSDGLIATMMLLGGMLGSVILPVCSDVFQRRKSILIICVVGMLPGLAGLAFAGDLSPSPDTVYVIALCSTTILGFFVLGSGPVGFQYIAEVTRPVPEAFSQGLVLLAGQISGMFLVVSMTINNHQWLSFLLQAFVGVTLVCLGAVLALRESPVVMTAYHDENQR